MPDHASREGQAGHLLLLGVQDTLKRLNMAHFVAKDACRHTSSTETAVIRVLGVGQT
jgi:hypothetical protein